MTPRKAFDSVAVYQIVKRLATPFDEFPAFRTGVIDENGKILVPKDERTDAQKDSLSVLDVFCLNIKKLLAHLPGGDSRLKSVAAAAALLRESESLSILAQLSLPKLKEALVEAEELLEAESLRSSPCRQTLSEFLAEEAVMAGGAADTTAVNNVGGGEVMDPKTVIVDQKRKKKIIRRDNAPKI